MFTELENSPKKSKYLPFLGITIGQIVTAIIKTEKEQGFEKIALPTLKVFALIASPLVIFSVIPRLSIIIKNATLISNLVSAVLTPTALIMTTKIARNAFGIIRSCF